MTTKTIIVDSGLDEIEIINGALQVGGEVDVRQSDVVTATPTAYNVTLTLANTEYTQAMPANCRSFEFQARTDVALRYAFEAGKVAGPTANYLVLKAGDYYFTPSLNQAAAPSTLYLAAAVGGTVVEVIAWV